MRNFRKLVAHDHFRSPEEYGEYLVHLYPEEDPDGLGVLPVTLQVTENCNLACTYCYQICKSRHRMSFDTAKKAIDLLFIDDRYVKADKRVGIILDFIGGEPLLEVDLIRKTYEYFLMKCRELNHPWLYRHRVSICSNGVLFLDDAFQKFYHDYESTISASISIDGPKELHDSCRKFPDGTGSFDIVKKSVDYAVANCGVYSTKATIAPENLPYLSGMIKFFYEGLHLNDIYANCTFEGPWTLSDANLLYHELVKIADYCYDNDTYSNFAISIFSEDHYMPMDYKDDNQNWCGGTGKMLAIDYRGNCYPCLRYMPSSLGTDVDPIIIGNVSDGIMTKPCERCVCEELQKITATSQSTDECISCPIAAGCAWCSALNYQTFGTVNKRLTNICVMHKAEALANAYYWNRFYEKHHVDCVFENFLPDDESIRIIGEEEYRKLKELISDQRNRAEKEG